MKIPNQTEISRISWRTIGDYFLEVLNLERGLGYTTRKFVLDPHGAVQEYLFKDRGKMIKPFSFLLLMTGVTTFLLLRSLKNNPDLEQGIDFSPLPLPPEVIEVMSGPFLEILMQYTNLMYMVSIPFVSLGSYWVFRRSKLFFTEHLVMNTYIFCIQSYFLLLLPLSMNSVVISMGIMAAYFVYFFYAYIRIFQLDTWSGIGYGLAVIMISQLVSTIVGVGIIGILVLLN